MNNAPTVIQVAARMLRNYLLLIMAVFAALSIMFTFMEPSGKLCHSGAGTTQCYANTRPAPTQQYTWRPPTVERFLQITG